MTAEPDRLATLRRDPETVAALLRVLANPDRLAILCHLAAKECSVSDIGDDLNLRQPALSQQLAELRDRGFVTTRRRSRHVYYSLAGSHILHLLEALNAGMVPGPTNTMLPPAKRRDFGDAAQFARLANAPRD